MGMEEDGDWCDDIVQCQAVDSHQLLSERLEGVRKYNDMLVE